MPFRVLGLGTNVTRGVGAVSCNARTSPNRSLQLVSSDVNMSVALIRIKNASFVCFHRVFFQYPNSRARRLFRTIRVLVVTDNGNAETVQGCPESNLTAFKIALIMMINWKIITT